MKKMKKTPKIVIIGSGFGGLTLAKGLAQKPVDVLLIDKNNYHTFQPLLYQVATGGLEPSNIAYPVRRILRKAKNVIFRMAEVLEVNYQNRQIVTNIGSIAYDYLVIATGSDNNFFNLDSTKSNFHSLKTVSQALDIRNTIFQNLEKLNSISDENLKDEVLNISVVGAGPSGVEIAGALAEMRKKVLPKDFPEYDFSKMHIYLFETGDKVLPAMANVSSMAGLKYLNQLGVKVLLNSKVESFDTHKITLDNGKTYHSSTVIWTAGVKASMPDADSNKLVAGRLAVNEFNQLLEYPNVFSIGDVAANSNTDQEKGSPMLAQVAIQQAKLLAVNILKYHSNQKMKPFVYKNKGTMATIGRNKAVVELPFIKFHGVLAWFVWMFIHLMALVGFRNKIITFLNWTVNYFNYDRPLNAIIRKYEKP